MKINFDNTVFDLTPSGKSYRATLDDKTFDAEILHGENGKLDLLIDSQNVTAYVSVDGAKRWVTVDGQTFVLTKSSGTKRGDGKHEHSGELSAPMPGQIRAVNVKEGDAVTKGQTLVVLEAMKMEIRVQTPFDGVVKSVAVETGQIVEREQILIELVGKLEG